MKSVSLPLSLASSGVATALLVLWAGAFLSEAEPGGAYHLPVQAGAPVCTAFFVGVQRPGDTHLYLRNVGQEPITARVEFIDDSGNKPVTQDYSIAPGSPRDVDLRRPPLGIGIKVSAGSAALRVQAETVFDDGSEPEPYRVTQCG